MADNYWDNICYTYSVTAKCLEVPYLGLIKSENNISTAAYDNHYVEPFSSQHLLMKEFNAMHLITLTILLDTQCPLAKGAWGSLRECCSLDGFSTSSSLTYPNESFVGIV